MGTVSLCHFLLIKVVTEPSTLKGRGRRFPSLNGTSSKEVMAIFNLPQLCCSFHMGMLHFYNESKHISITFFSLQVVLVSFFNLQITYTLPKPHRSPNCERAPLRQEVQDLIHYPRYGCPPTECRELINISLLGNVILCMPLKSAFFFVFISHVTLLIHIELKWHFYYKE